MVLRFLQSRQRYSYNGIDHIPVRLRKNYCSTSELRWPARLGQRAGKARRARRAGRGGSPICPHRAFLASLALHAPRSVAVGGLFQHPAMVVRGCAACSAKKRSGTRPVSTVLASVRAKTGPVPAVCKVFAHSFSVVPVVKTSSTRRMRFFARSCGLRISNAFRRFCNRACRVNVVWGSVAVSLTRFVAETGRAR